MCISSTGHGGTAGPRTATGSSLSAEGEALSAARAVLSERSLAGSCATLERAVSALLGRWAAVSHVLLLQRSSGMNGQGESPGAMPGGEGADGMRAQETYALVSFCGELSLPVRLRGGGHPADGLVGAALARTSATPLLVADPSSDQMFSDDVDGLLLPPSGRPAALLLLPLRDAAAELIGLVSACGRDGTLPPQHAVNVIGPLCSLCGLHMGHTLAHLRITRLVAAALHPSATASGGVPIDAGAEGSELETQ